MEKVLMQVICNLTMKKKKKNRFKPLHNIQTA